MFGLFATVQQLPYTQDLQKRMHTHILSEQKTGSYANTSPHAITSIGLTTPIVFGNINIISHMKYFVNSFCKKSQKALDKTTLL